MSQKTTQMAFLSLSLGLSLGACASAPARAVPTVQAEPSTLSEAPNAIEQEIKSADAVIEQKHPERIPLEFNAQVDQWIRYFTLKDRERFARFLSRGLRYKKIVQETLRKNDVPQELYYLALIESGYQVHAKSHAHAVGPWQFISGTATRFGLKVSREVDERRDIIRATEAASKYLKGLYTAFQSWYLAMASYNAGELRILGAVVKGRSRDFWELVERKALPAETRDYVPKFLAAVIIGRNPAKYGFKGLRYEEFPKVERAWVARGTPLARVAAQAGLPVAKLRDLNPHLLHDRVPRTTAYAVWVPTGRQERVQTVSASEERSEKKPETLQTPVRAVKTVKVHRVRSGERLRVISRKYGVPVRAIKKANRLRNDRLIVGQRLRIPRA